MTLSLSMTLTGGPALRQTLEALGREAPVVMGEAMFEDAEATMTEIKEVPIVPVDTGVLRASGYVVPPEVTPVEAVVTLGFGGAAAAYAIVQHERLDYRHPVGQAKYLEAPVRRNAARTVSHLVRRGREWLARRARR